MSARIDELFAARDTHNPSAASSNVCVEGDLTSTHDPVDRGSDIDVPDDVQDWVRIERAPVDQPESALTAAVGEVTTPLSHQAPQMEAQQVETIAPQASTEGGRSRDWASLKDLVVALGQCTSTFGPLKTVADELVACIETYQSAAGGRRDFERLHAELQALFRELQQHYSGGVPPAATTSMESLCRSIQKELTYVKEKRDRGIARRVIETRDDADQILACYRKIQRDLQRLTLNANLSMWKITDELATNARLDRLSPAFSACFNSNQAVELKRGECTPGTRVGVLAQLHEWVHNRTPGSVYWLNGMAGTGKTTIAYTLCTELELAHNLGASFFCSRSLPECRDVNRIVPSIAYQLAQFSQPFRCALSRVLEVERDVHTQLLRIQFEKLIVKPIDEVRDTLPENIVVVIDALDECDSKKSTRQILEALLTKTTDLPIKFFMASRPEPEIREQMKKQAGRKAISRLVLHELEKGTVQGDIETYLRAALQQIEPSESQIKALIERAGILFIYAATVVRYIGCANFTKNPRKRLKNVLEVSSTGGNNPYKEIDELYTLVLAAAFDDPESDPDERADTKNVLYTALCAHEPLTVSALSGLLGLRDMDRAHAALAPLWSILHVVESNGLVTTLHASFPDYMFDRNRSKQYHCDPATHDHALATHCFDCLKDTKPQFNICGLETSCITDDKIPNLDSRIKEMVSSETLYACRYWEAHLQRAKGSPDILDRLDNFLTSQLLVWIEVVNLNKYLTTGVEMLRRVAEWCTRQSCSEDLKQLVHEAWKFIAAFASAPVSQSTPHIYLSMLPFWPESSPIMRYYAKRIQHTLRTKGAAMPIRSLSLLATWPMGGEVTSFAWSPDSTRIAFASSGQIYVRNSLTGHTVLGPLNKTSLLSSLGIIPHIITSIGYSPDGARIVSGSQDGAVCLWDSETGKKLLGPLKGHTKEIKSVVFSSTGNWIVSGSKDDTLRVWDSQSGKGHLGPIMGHDGSVMSVAFSPDGTRIVSGSQDMSLRMWDAGTGKPILTSLRGHSGSVNSVAFSPDGAHIISGSSDRTIRMWDTQTGKSTLRPFKGHADEVNSVAFSPDGARIISGSTDHTIRIWDARTGRSMPSSFDGHTGPISSAVFSPDGTRIASASGDTSVRIWDTRADDLKPRLLEGHTDSVRSVAFSPDGTHIVSGSGDRTIRIWNAKTGKSMRGSFKGHNGEINSVAFSPDGTRIASGSDDATLLIWDVQTGQPVSRPLEGHTSLIWSVAFSPDGTRIVSGSGDKTIRMWDAQTGKKVLRPFKGHTGEVNSVMFSPDGTRIASGSDDKVIRVWDAQNRWSLESPPSERTSLVLSVAFSPDGTRIASGFRDHTIRLWDVHTGELVLGPLEGHFDSVHSVAFSPDGTLIASGSGDRTIQMWDAQTGKPLLPPFKGHAGAIHSVAFSPDGTRIVSGSDDNTIRMWDVRTRVSMPPSSVLTSPFAWEISEDGWIVDRDDRSTLLVWLPWDLHPFLLPPRAVFTTAAESFICLNFETPCLGTSWTGCYQPCV